MKRSYFERGCEVVRKPRNGRVKVLGRWYRPKETHRKYNGELDGVKCLFYKYPNHNGNTINFWGTKTMADEIGGGYDMGNEPNVIDGKIYWCFWGAIDAAEIKTALNNNG